MLGCGFSPVVRQVLAPSSKPDPEWVTLDSNPRCGPNVVYDLNNLSGSAKLPFSTGEFDEIHAYEVLEHCGQQGDYATFFAQFREFWRILKSDGILVGTCPAWDSKWAWGDPGHTRVIQPETLGFLTQYPYKTLGQHASSDYRAHVHPYWWTLVHSQTQEEKFMFGLQKDLAYAQLADRDGDYL